MARLSPKEIRGLTPAERQKKLENLYNEMSSIRVDVATGGGTDNPYKIQNVRRGIARILTIQREEELEASK
ncbi:MAG: 50S ribosomal protein L29 [Candidatus Thorarchaeota archaeon]|nr:50S ribosomal protein L29 [Candidatus Thorarchaeota archaeon]TFH08120.1 MAG: 50S ribosomal protein L29 [Candidatus Thorarchaeota archaeon]